MIPRLWLLNKMCLSLPVDTLEPSRNGGIGQGLGRPNSNPCSATCSLWPKHLVLAQPTSQGCFADKGYDHVPHHKIPGGSTTHKPSPNQLSTGAAAAI